MAEKFNKIFLLNLVITFCSLAISATESRAICTRAKNNSGHKTCAGALKVFSIQKYNFENMHKLISRTTKQEQEISMEPLYSSDY